jgi:uncharacterized phosphosugar-binding protein
MDMFDEYTKCVTALFDKIQSTQRQPIEELVNEMIKRIDEGRLIHVVGTGAHSSMPVEEFLCRHEQPVYFNAILDPGICMSHGPAKAIFGLQYVPGYARTVLEYNRIGEGDLVIITTAYGTNLLTIEMAQEAKNMGALVAGITSRLFADSLPRESPRRHPSKKSLHEVADIVVDTFVPPEHFVRIPGLPGSKNAMVCGSIAQIFTVDLIMGCLMQKMVDMGKVPDRWTCSLDEDGFDANEVHLEEYFGKVKYL